MGLRIIKLIFKKHRNRNSFMAINILLSVKYRNHREQIWVDESILKSDKELVNTKGK